MNNYNKYILITTIIVSVLIPQKFNSLNNNSTKEQQKKLTQARTLENSGLIDQAIIAYNDILNQFPSFKKAFQALKRIYINKADWIELEKITNNYLDVNKYSIISKIEILDFYIITNNDEWENIIKEVANIEPKNSNYISYTKKTLSILLRYDKITFVLDLVNNTRAKIEDKSFYALELGNFFSLKLDFKNALDEYLIYLSDKPKNIKFISQRIMFLADYQIAVEIIKSKLSASSNKESKIVLSALEFKLKNYKQAYEVLHKINNVDDKKLRLCMDLIKVNEFNLAQNILNDIIDSSENKIILNKAIFQLGYLYEAQIKNSITILPISNDIYKNEILKSPYIKLNDEHKNLLFKAITIYDSLSIYNKDYTSSFHLAEIKYKIIEDLDGAKKIYYDIYNNHNSLDYKSKSLSSILEIDLLQEGADKIINRIDSMYHTRQKKELLEILDLKKIQTYFYQLNRDSLIYNCNKLLKTIPRDHNLYNDILDILSLFYNYKDNELEKYIDAKYKIIQNKRLEAIDILDSIGSDNALYDLALFESIYLETLDGDYANALQKIKTMDRNSDTNYYIEEIFILEGEIYDYLLVDISKAVDTYLNFLELFPKSIYYDLIRLRLRELSS